MSPGGSFRTLVITGMHRSGTSLLARVFAGAGLDLGAHLLPAAKGNPFGHFEDADVVALHEQLLRARGASAFRVPELWRLRLSAGEERALHELVARRGAAAPVWGFKDPRATLFLDLWRERLACPCFLLVYRHPIEVVLSLLRRGIDLEVQIDPGAALAAWTSYNRRLLAFLQANRPCSTLWNVRGAARSLTAAVAPLCAELGLSPGAAAADGYDPGELHQQRWSAGIPWRTIVPGALELFDRLEAAAELPAAAAEDRGAAPSPQGRERDLLEANEHLLAAVLRGPGARSTLAVSPSERAVYSELRLQAAVQEQRIAGLHATLAASEEQLRQLRTATAGWERIAATRGGRLLGAYWRAAERLRQPAARLAEQARRIVLRLRARVHTQPPNGRYLPHEVLLGCVAENRPEMLAQALRLVQSIRWFGGRLAAARVWVCVVDGGDGAERVEPAWRLRLAAYGAEVRGVSRFDLRGAAANKLQFLKAALAAAGDGVTTAANAAHADPPAPPSDVATASCFVLLDCDTVVVQDPLPWLRRGVVQAKIADLESVTHEHFVRLFRHYRLRLPPRRHLTTLTAVPTIPYCNSGFVSLPADLAGQLVPAWRHYNRDILDHLDLLGACAHHSNQAALSLAMAACRTPFVAAPPALNFPLHLGHLEPPPDFLASDPVILHYHALSGADGRLLPSRYPLAQARIAVFNRRLDEELAREAQQWSRQPVAAAAV